jgi:hypothetical protein
MISQEHVHRIQQMFRRSTRFYRVSFATAALCPLLLVYGLYEIIQYAVTERVDALHSALLSLLMAYLIDQGGQLILIPYWNSSLAKLEAAIEKTEEEIYTPAKYLSPAS